MSEGMSIHIGLNNFDSTHYGSNRALIAAENDARYMYDLLENRGFDRVLLTGTNANFKNVTEKIEKVVENLDDDGTMLITFSGHGGRISDYDDNEVDGFDETWCLYDEQLLDDELYELFTRFKSGQKILAISDSCHSGTITGSFSSKFADADRVDLTERGFDYSNFDKAVVNMNGYPQVEFDSIQWEQDKLLIENLNIDIKEIISTRNKSLSKAVLDDVVKNPKNIKRYIEKQKDTANRLAARSPKTDTRELVKASVLLISACQDWQFAVDGDDYGVFTKSLKQVVEEDGLSFNYLELHEKLWYKLENSGQNPNYSKTGSPNTKFELNQCFTI